MKISFRGTLARELCYLLEKTPLDQHFMVISLFIKDIEKNQKNEVFCVISDGVLVYGRFSDSNNNEFVASATIN